jgi:energy-coupling factor transporter ATP-binding protein EcfA2
LIRRIELVNFMSHARTVIEPAEGLTVLVGPNNCGKSAVVAALQILCHNDNSTYVTRHNEKECSVTVETDDGHIVQWCRKNNSPKYFIDGKPFDRLDRGAIPAGLHEVLRMPKVVAEGNREFDVHFGEQKTPVFLLDKPGSHAAQFFASSSDAASLVEMQKRHQQKMTDARRERIQLQAKAEKLTADLSVLAATNQIEIDVEQLESRHEELGRLASNIGQITQDVQTLDQAIVRHHRRESEATAFGALMPPPILVSPQPLEEVIAKLTRTQLDLERHSARAVSFSLLQIPPDIADERPFAELIRDLRSAHLRSARVESEWLATRAIVAPPVMTEVETLRTTALRINALSREVTLSEQQLIALEPLATVPVLSSEISLTQGVQNLLEAEAAAWRTEAVHRQLDTLVAAPDLTDTREIEAAICDLNRATDAVALLAQELKRAQRGIEEGERELRAWAEQQQLCPACGSPLDPNQVVVHAGSFAGGHPHG